MSAKKQQQNTKINSKATQKEGHLKNSKKNKGQQDHKQQPDPQVLQLQQQQQQQQDQLQQQQQQTPTLKSLKMKFKQGLPVTRAELEMLAISPEALKEFKKNQKNIVNNNNNPINLNTLGTGSITTLHNATTSNLVSASSAAASGAAGPGAVSQEPKSNNHKFDVNNIGSVSEIDEKLQSIKFNMLKLDNEKKLLEQRYRQFQQQKNQLEILKKQYQKSNYQQQQAGLKTSTDSNASNNSKKVRWTQDQKLYDLLSKMKIEGDEETNGFDPKNINLKNQQQQQQQHYFNNEEEDGEYEDEDELDLTDETLREIYKSMDEDEQFIQNLQKLTKPQYQPQVVQPQVVQQPVVAPKYQQQPVQFVQPQVQLPKSSKNPSAVVNTPPTPSVTPVVNQKQKPSTPNTVQQNTTKQTNQPQKTEKPSTKSNASSTPTPGPSVDKKQQKASKQQISDDKLGKIRAKKAEKLAKKKEKKREKIEQKAKATADQKSNKSSSSSSSTTSNGKTQEKRSRKSRFHPHVSKEEFEKGLAEGRYYFGQLRVNPKKYNDAYVTIAGTSGDCFVDGLKSRNRAFHTDIIGFEIVPDQSVWKKRPKHDQDEEEEEESELAALKDTSVLENGNDSGTVVLSSSALEAMKVKSAIEEKFSEEESNSESESESEEEDGEDSEDSDDSEDSICSDDETGEVIIREDVQAEQKLLKPDSLDNDDGETILFNQPNSTNANTSSTTTTTKIENNNDNQKSKSSKSAAHGSKKSKEDVPELKQNLDKLDDQIKSAIKSNLYVTVKVIYIVESKHTNPHVGIIVDEPNNPVFATFSPVDTTLPKCYVFKESIPQFRANPEQYKRRLVSVKYGQWKDSSIYPVGVFKTVYGECGAIEPETKALLDEFQVDTSIFSKEVMDCLPKINSSAEFKVSSSEKKKRRDLRSVDIVTIDPDTAKDLDDALHCIPLPDGNFEVGVHIADVSHFVKPNTALDKCAASRATTVYLVQKAIPMLPSLLSEELCSLNMGVERYAFSVIWTLTPKGEVVNEWFGKTIIKSISRLTYAAAQALISDEITNDWNQFQTVSGGIVRPDFGPNTVEHIQRVQRSVKSLHSIAMLMRTNRVANGAFTIHPSKLAFALDDKGNPVSTKIYQIYDSHRLVEEFMLLANMRVAEKIAKTFPENSLLRRHPDPNPMKLDNFIDFCQKHGWTIDSSSVSSFGDSIKNLKEQIADPRVLQAIQMLSVRSMKLAEYFCTMDQEVNDWHHYALNVDYYTHFTSPIRRYADVIVHRLLELSIEFDQQQSKIASGTAESVKLKSLPSAEDVSAIALHCNEKKLNARRAQERSDKVFLCILLQNSITITHAVVLAVGKSFLNVIVPQFGSEQKIFFDQMKSSKQVISVTYNEKEKLNVVQWSPKDNVSDKPFLQSIGELSTIPIRLEVNKERFPIDTRCLLVHPLEDINVF